jgi:hypothetical protein
MPELSEAGIDYGRAFCLAPDRQAVPLDQLTPDERACVTRTGLGFEERVQQRLGLVPQDGVGYPVQVPATGARIAQLGMDAQGVVTLCLPDQRCVVVGQGPAAAAAAEETLSLLGFQVGSTPGPAAPSAGPSGPA